MDTDISKVLSYEIKKELADRYFGFRKFIEQEKDDLSEQVKSNTLNVEQKVADDLVRIYTMLQNKDLIGRFFELTGLNEEMFYDPYTISSPTIRKRLFADMKTRGLTRAGRFKNLFLGCYESLVKNVEEYRKNIAALQEDHETIVEEINLFYRKNDLTSIMGFLRSLDSDCQMGSDLQNASTGLVSPGHFEKKMRVQPPNPIDEALSLIPPVTPLAVIKRQLKKLASQAYKINKYKLPYEY